MSVLCVAPNPDGSGEAITASNIADELEREGQPVTVFAHPFAARFFGAASRMVPFADRPEETGRRWRQLLADLRPDLILFADYPLLRLSHQGRALLEAESQRALDDSGAALVTLDHLGLAQGPLTISFGPPHLDPLLEYLPSVPARMQILLPCPVQSPVASAARRGDRCRYLPQRQPLSASRRQAVRERYVQSDAERLVLHATPGWALKYCRRHGLPYPRFLGRLLTGLLGGLPQPVVVVCVSAGEELPETSSAPNLRIVRAPQLPPADYDDLLQSSDLMLTDNRISVGLGKAACWGVPGVALRNSFSFREIVERGDGPATVAIELERACTGSVFPFEVFPIWSRADVDTLGVFEKNPLTDCVVTAEVFGGDDTRSVISELLLNAELRASMRLRQAAYAHCIRQLPAAHELLLAALHGRVS